MISNYNWDSPTTSKSPHQKVSPSPSTSVSQNATPRKSNCTPPATASSQQAMISNYNWDSPTTSKSPPPKVSPSPSTPTPSPLQASINTLSAKLPPTSVNCALPNPIRPKVFATRVKPFAARPERQVSNVKIGRA